MTSWNSAQYLKFKKERTQPAVDLASRISVKNPKNILDIGCGPGNSTYVLYERYPHADILGIDNSENMIETARAAYPELKFMLCDAEKFSGLEKKFDIVFSNACIQWIPNHAELLSHLMNLLDKGGVLAVQIPANYEEPIYKIIADVSSSDKWKSKFSHPRKLYSLRPNEYYDILSKISSDFNMWCTTYCHRMKSHAQILEWYRGTGLRPYLDVLSEDEQADFEDDIYEVLVNTYPTQQNGEIIFRFPRLFFTAVK